MQNCLLKGYSQEILKKKKDFFFFLKSSSDHQDELQKYHPPNKVSVVENKKISNEPVLTNSSTNTETLIKTEKLTPKEANLFRVLAVNYLAHLVVFTYAGWMGR
jgi:hypothetical protein